MNNAFATIPNQGSIQLDAVPVLRYEEFAHAVSDLLKNEGCHCVNYYGYASANMLRFICCIADDLNHNIRVLAYEMPADNKKPLHSIAREHYSLHIYEREITENFGVEFAGHPWPKPVRYAWNRSDRKQVINNYPFYKIDSEELHEVGVGPIHAGVIEPGHFRFLCNGEQVLHLEIQLGWQHRGVEALFLDKPGLIQRTVLSESIAGDTALGHSLAFVSLMESLANIRINDRLNLERTLSLELERVAMHIGDMANVNIGMAYQLASSVFGTLRTPVINYAQTWCGNRFGKGLNRVGGTHYPFTSELADKLVTLLDKFNASYIPMANRLFALPSFLMRAENIGKVTENQMRLIGAVGMAARVAGVPRDIRQSHPFAAYNKYSIDTKTLEQGDVWARVMLRDLEIRDSIHFIQALVRKIAAEQEESPKPIAASALKMMPNALCVSLIEGWRGEICHCGITDEKGALIHYKVKDPSFHNWLALALSLRDLEISDFPINNKSYNLSYCGFDL